MTFRIITQLVRNTGEEYLKTLHKRPWKDDEEEETKEEKTVENEIKSL